MTQTVPGQRTLLYDAEALQGVLDVMAWQAAAWLDTRPQAQLAGILRRGAPLARMLQQRLQRLLPGHELPLLELRIQRYADDLRLLHPETLLTESPGQAALDLRGTALLVVDDVLYQGFSTLRAVDYLLRKGAGEIATAVLVDRCVARIPLHADIVGLRLQIAAGDVIECHVPPYEETFCIELLRPGA